MSRFSRREFVAGSLLASTVWGKGSRIDRSRISAITDEIARSQQASIDFAHQYGLKWLELRDVPGVRGSNYFMMPEEELKVSAKQFKDAGLGISFLNANLLKFGLPGTEPRRRTPEAPEAREKRIAREKVRFEEREQDLRKCIRSAQILDCRYVRTFTFSRVEEPEKLFPQIADIIGAFSKIAEAEGVVLLVENETSCNVGTCAELAKLLKALPSKAVGINWDAMNGADMKEPALEVGYPLLPKKRIHNVQIKGKTIIDFPEHKLDWVAIFHALERDGYKDNVGLETHIFGEQQVAKSHESMKAILKTIGAT